MSGYFIVDTPTNASVVAGEESVKAAAKEVSIGRMGTADEIANVVVFLSKCLIFDASVCWTYFGE